MINLLNNSYKQTNVDDVIGRAVIYTFEQLYPLLRSANFPLHKGNSKEQSSLKPIGQFNPKVVNLESEASNGVFIFLWNPDLGLFSFIYTLWILKPRRVKRDRFKNCSNVLLFCLNWSFIG